MQPVTVTPRESPVHFPVPGSNILITGWRVEGIGMLVGLENCDYSPYLSHTLWNELGHFDESRLFRRLRD